MIGRDARRLKSSGNKSIQQRSTDVSLQIKDNPYMLIVVCGQTGVSDAMVDVNLCGFSTYADCG